MRRVPYIRGTPFRRTEHSLLGHNKQSGGFREAPQQKLEGYEQIPTADELRRLNDGQSGSHGDQPERSETSTDRLIDQSIDPITGQPLSEALRARPDPAAGKKLADARKAEAEEQMKRIAEGATTRPRDGLEHLRPDLEDLPRPAVFVPELVAGIRWRARPGAARRHRLGQDLHHGPRGHRGGPAAPGADPGAEQDAGRAALRRVQAFFPDNAVEYFVSYYDYYQPEAYVPRSDTYIEKESSINEQIDRMRHSATRALLERDDVIIVASVSCIYGIGSVETYTAMTFADPPGRRAHRPAPAAARPRRRCSTSATTSTSSAAPSACAATSSTSSRPTTRTAPGASRCSATRSRSITEFDPLTGRSTGELPAGQDLRQLALRHARSRRSTRRSKQIKAS
jgi:hypothetical protein